MSRGRSRHQGSRRRAYSARQRDMRERLANLRREEATLRGDTWSTAEDEGGADAQPVTPWRLAQPGRAGAA